MEVEVTPVLAIHATSDIESDSDKIRQAVSVVTESVAGEAKMSVEAMSKSFDVTSKSRHLRARLLLQIRVTETRNEGRSSRCPLQKLSWSRSGSEHQLLTWLTWTSTASSKDLCV